MQKAIPLKPCGLFLTLITLLTIGAIKLGAAADGDGGDGDNAADCSQMTGLLPVIAPAVMKCMPRETLAGVGGGGPRINCMGKCLFTELGVFGSDGQLNFTGAIAFVQKAFPKALSGGGSGGASGDKEQSMQKCLELTMDFKPDEPSCESYGPFFQCIMRGMSERMGPKARQCLSKMAGGANSPLSGVMNIVGSTVSNGVGAITGRAQPGTATGGRGGLGGLLGRDRGAGGLAGLLGGNGPSGGLNGLLGGAGNGGGMLTRVLGRGGIGNGM